MSAVSVTKSGNNDTLDLQISDPVSMLNEIARRYESTERILMEYVDNALDDAETLYRDNNNVYPYHIHIEVMVDFDDRSVIIRDNCRGMQKETLERIVRNVGESQKRGLTWVNGRFGFGVQAFRAAAEAIRFQTRHSDGPHLALALQRDQHRGIRGAQVLAKPFPSDTGIGTEVALSAFEEVWFEKVTVDSIREEIESHFERLLARPNLEITVREVGQDPVYCQPFRYRDVPGKDIQRTLKLELNGKTYQVDVHLKIADVEVPGRTVRFFARGRRVNQVAEIKSFLRKSAYRTSVWGHPQLLGYIEVGEVVRPVITRDDFVRNKGRRVFYEAILNLEEEIKIALDRVNEAQRDTTLNHLESVLRQVLESIARQDRRQLRLYTAARREARSTKAKETMPSNANNTSPSSARPPVTNTPDISKSPISSYQQQIQPRPHDPTPAESAKSRPVGVSPATDDELEFSYEVEKTPKTVQTTRRRHTFDIQFLDIPPDADGQIKRSYLVESTIYINVAHPDFQERMIYTRLGQPRVTDRLGAYIAATISIHYKDQFYTRYGYIPDRRDLLFDEQVDFIFRLESALREHLPALERELARQKKQETEEN
jgi:hypothetical protein